MSATNSDFNSTIVPQNSLEKLKNSENKSYSLHGSWFSASKDNPCLLCGKESWCWQRSDGNRVVCAKTDRAPDGWFEYAVAPDGRKKFVKKGSQDRRQKFQLPDPEEIFPLSLNPKDDLPQWITINKVGKHEELQTEYLYPDAETGEPLGRVVRKQWSDRRPAYKGKTKEVLPSHWVKPPHPDMGDKGWWSDRGKGSKKWPLYREAEVRDAIASGTKVAFLLGGELNVETAREMGLIAFCNQGGEGQYTKEILNFLQKNKPFLLCIPHDNDDAGRKFAQKIINGCRKIEVPAIAIDLKNIYPTLKEKGDITNIVKDAGMDKFEFVQRLEEEILQVLSVEETESKGLSADQPSNQNDLVKDPNDVGNRTLEAIVLDNLFKKDWVTLNDTYFHYSGSGYWSKVTDKVVLKAITDQCRAAYNWVETKSGFARKFKYATDAKKVSAFKFSRDQLHKETETTNRHLRAFLNCTVDVRTGESFPHDPNHFLTTAITADYEPDQECPEVFLDFIKRAYGEDLVELIRACTSMFLDPTAPYGKFIHLIGASGSGKGTLLRLWGELFGLEHYRSGDFSNLSTAEGRHQYLSGCSLFAVPDTGGYQQGLKPFYELVDNGAMAGRALFSSNAYQKQWDVRFIIASVEHLHIENSGDGWDRRCIPIPTKPRDGIEDPTLGTRLAEVKGQIISWALAMPREERDRLLLHPSSNERIVNLKLEAAIQGDPVRAFIDKCLRPKENATKIHSHELHSKFNAFAQAHGYQSWGENKLVGHLKTLLPQHRVDQRRRCKGLMIPAHWKNMEFLEDIFVDRSGTNDFGNVSNPNYECIKSMCGEGGLTEFAEFGSPRSPNPDPTSSVGDLAKTFKGQSFQENGSPRSPRSPKENDLEEKVENNFPVQPEKKLDLNTPPTPLLGDLGDLGDLKPETIENTLVKTDHPTDHPVIQPKVGDLGDLGDLKPETIENTLVKTDHPVIQPKVDDPVKVVAALILQCQTWVAVVTALDAVAATIKRERAIVFDTLIKVGLQEKSDRQHLINLLAAHIQQNPEDQDAYNWIPSRYKGLKQKAKVLAMESPLS
jgi:phage/plasmid-associated DNA primase